METVSRSSGSFLNVGDERLNSPESYTYGATSHPARVGAATTKIKAAKALRSPIGIL
jgi:hypothetical protein